MAALGAAFVRKPSRRRETSAEVRQRRDFYRSVRRWVDRSQQPRAILRAKEDEMSKCKGKVVDKFQARPLVDGSPNVNVIVVDQETEAAGVVRIYFTCDEATYGAIWKDARLEWSTRQVVEVRTSTPASAMARYDAHPDVHFVPGPPTVATVSGCQDNCC
jgi:hypothetical protein